VSEPQAASAEKEKEGQGRKGNHELDKGASDADTKIGSARKNRKEGTGQNERRAPGKARTSESPGS